MLSPHEQRTHRLAELVQRRREETWRMRQAERTAVLDANQQRVLSALAEEEILDEHNQHTLAALQRARHQGDLCLTPNDSPAS